MRLVRFSSSLLPTTMSQLPSSQSSLRLAVAHSAYERVRDRLRDLTTALLEVVDVSIARDWAEEFGNIVVRCLFFLLLPAC